MVRIVKEQDYEVVYTIGEQLCDNYRKLYNLEELMVDNYSYIYVFEEDGVIKGFIHITKLYDVIDVVNIVVDEKSRRKGIGTLLLDYLIREHNDIKSITLEVNVKNMAAVSLYKKFGFEVVGIRKKYYHGEDGYLMKRSM